MTDRKILVTGATGQLGRAFQALIPEAMFADRTIVDLAQPHSIDSVLAFAAPAVVINCAAYTAVDDAEDEEELATTINGDAVGAMAGWSAANGARLATFSTDYVFAGTANEPYVESSPTDPINAYGRSKRSGEIAALEHDTSLVLRTSWLISGTRPNFVATMLDLAAAGRSLRVVDDQVGTPTIATDLARFTLDALDAGATGLLHATNAGTATWFELATTAVSLGGLESADIQPCTTAEYPTPAVRPGYSVMVSERNLGLTPMPHWRESLPGVVRALVGSGSG